MNYAMRVPAIMPIGDYWVTRSKFPRDRKQPEYRVILKEARYASFGVPYIAKPHLKLCSAPECSAGDFGESAQLVHSGAEHPNIREEIEEINRFLGVKII